MHQHTYYNSIYALSCGWILFEFGVNGRILILFAFSPVTVPFTVPLLRTPSSTCSPFFVGSSIVVDNITSVVFLLKTSSNVLSLHAAKHYQLINRYTLVEVVTSNVSSRVTLPAWLIQHSIVCACVVTRTPLLLLLLLVVACWAFPAPGTSANQTVAQKFRKSWTVKAPRFRSVRNYRWQGINC